MRDVLQIIRAAESYYPQALGAVAQKDERLRSSLTRYLNANFREIERITRWRRGWKNTTIVTVPSTSTYSLAGGRWLFIHEIYYRLSTGTIVPLELLEEQEGRLVYGDGANAAPGKPRYYSVLNQQIQLYPTPDDAGPDSGNYTLQIEYYSELPQIIETVGTWAGGAPTTITVPATAFLTEQGADPANPGLDTLSLRNAGNLTGLAAPNDKSDYVGVWSAFPNATDVTIATAAASAVTTFPLYLYSTNWLIDVWPKVPLFSLLREIAAYLQSTTDVSMWEGRYQKELSDLMDWDVGSHADHEIMAAAVSGQREPILKGRGYWDWASGFWGGW